ncbi:MAG: argininosuccinate synthase [bacterium]|nr:argininosuccinate synthase [Acidimicrobiia bacterium]MCY4650189.1 argininosuccinate synthase [bacterium]
MTRVVLAYSGGLDTSVILAWLREVHDAEVITFTADVGQGEEVAEAREKALQTGAVEAVVSDLRREFVSEAVFPAFRAAALYEGYYLLGTSLARPIITEGMIETARRFGADAISHGATGKGNDQVRFELSTYALQPDIRIIAPWREWDLKGRADLVEYARRRGIPVPVSPDKPYSTDANLLHISYEGGILEDPWASPPDDMFALTVDPRLAPDEPEEVVVAVEKGNPVAVNGRRLEPVALLEELNRLGGRHGVGRVDIVENRFVGIKSRGVYETPGGTILYHALRAVESITLDRQVAHLRDELAPRYAEMVYNGFWFAPERNALQTLFDEMAEAVTGEARMSLYKGSVTVSGRRAPYSLYDPDRATFEEDKVFDQADAGGFIRINALRLRPPSDSGSAEG